MKFPPHPTPKSQQALIQKQSSQKNRGSSPDQMQTLATINYLGSEHLLCTYYPLVIKHRAALEYDMMFPLKLPFRAVIFPFKPSFYIFYS